jgi:two-component sensor histidine kinase
VTLGARLVLLILLAAVPIFLVEILQNYQLREERKIAFLQTVETLAGLVAARQDRVVEGARQLLIGTSYLQSIRERDAERCNQRLQEIGKQVPELTALAVLSPDGERWCVSLTGTGPINLADRDYFKATLRSGMLQTSNYILGRQTGEGSIAFTYPIRDEGGAIQSVLFLAYRTRVLSEMLNDPPLPAGAVVALLGADGIVAARWPDPEAWVGKDLSSSAVVRQAIQERKGVHRGVEEWAGSGEYAFAFTPMRPPTNLTVLVGLPLAPVLREAEAVFWRAVTWTTLIFLLAAMLALLGGHLLFGRPLRALQGSVDALARGDFSARPSKDVRGSKELSLLATRFERMADALAERQIQLQKALGQKELLLKEVNHRVKNSLQLVASLLGLQRARIKDPEARRQFDEAGQRINTVAKIHQRLYRDEDVDRVAFDKFLQELCEELNSAIGDHHEATVVCEATSCQLPTEDVIPLALIVNELVTNALKYSYPDGDGVIRVSCATRDQALVLSVSDSGGKLPDDFDPAKSSGLGMKMITALAKQLRATFSLSQDSAGKSFIVHLPIGGTK